MPSWIFITVGAILVYVALCFLFDKQKFLPVPLYILIFPIIIFIVVRNELKEKKKTEANKTTEPTYKISESTIRRIGKEGITYRDKD
jgi:hypothetical protein